MNQCRVLLLILSYLLYLHPTTCQSISTADELIQSRGNPYNAILNLTSFDPVTGELRTDLKPETGQFASNSRMESEWGWVVHVLTAEGSRDACTPPVNAPPSGGERWIALVERGKCRFHEKILNVAVVMNASAVVIYDNEENHLLTMQHKVDDVVSVFIKKDTGLRIASLVDSGSRVFLYISRGDMMQSNGSYGSVNRSSVLFVVISFIVLMLISVAWLVFYYAQRVRYAHTKDRISKRLVNAAKKALNKMGQKTLRKGDKETETEFELCAVCVESYRPSEIIRILPCKHIFHKLCVDPWLLDHRTCPICKLDILKACGINVMGKRENTTVTNLNASSLLLESGVNYDARPPAASRGESLCPPSPQNAAESDRELLLDRPSIGGGFSRSFSSMESPSRIPGEFSVMESPSHSSGCIPSRETAQVYVEPVYRGRRLSEDLNFVDDDEVDDDNDNVVTSSHGDKIVIS